MRIVLAEEKRGAWGLFGDGSPPAGSGQSPVMGSGGKTLLLNEHAILNVPLMKIVKFVHAVSQCMK